MQTSRAGASTRRLRFCDGNVTPWSLDTLLETTARPARFAAARQGGGVRTGVDRHGPGRFVRPSPDHHPNGRAVGEGRSVLCRSARLDASRAPEGYRAVTATTHTAVAAPGRKRSDACPTQRRTQSVAGAIDGDPALRTVKPDPAGQCRSPTTLDPDLRGRSAAFRRHRCSGAARAPPLNAPGGD